MKNILLIVLSLLSIFFSVNAQWNNTGDNATTGNIAIHDNSQLRIRGLGVSNTGLGFNSATETFRISQAKDIYDRFISIGGYAGTTWVPQLTVNTKTGYTGIGTSTPGAKLDVNGVIRTYNIDNSTANWDNLSMWSEGSKSFIQSNGDESGLFIKSNGGNKVVFESNIGIGTSNPLTKLHINNGDNSYGSILAQANEAPFQLYTKTLTTVRPSGEIYTDREAFRIGLKYNDNEDNGYISFYRGSNVDGGYLGFSTVGKERIRIAPDGNVGIGTTNPKALLSISGNSNGWMQTIKGSVTDVDQFVGIKLLAGYMNDEEKWSGIAAVGENIHSNSTGLGLFSSKIERMRITGTGTVGIGISNPNPIYKLDVNGTIHAKEIIIDTNFALADYVFEPTYNLKPLAEVEAYVNENKHLPEMPSATEVADKGLNMGEMQNKLLQKIEELTLYVIELEKINKTQEEKLIKINKTQEEKLTKMDKLEKDLELLKAIVANR